MSLMGRAGRFLAACTAFVAAAVGTVTARAQTAPPSEAPPPSVAPSEATPPSPPAPPAPPGSASPTPTDVPPPPNVDNAPPPPPPGALPPPPDAFDLEPPPLPARKPASAVARFEAPPVGSTRIPARDPAADRGIIMPTAYTHPKGTFYVSDYEVLLLQFGYAFTDDTQISLTGFPPISDGGERLVVLDFTLKSSLYRGPLVRVAALGSMTGLGANETGVIGVGRVGAVAQLCLEERCDRSVSVSSDVALVGVLIMANGVSAIYRVAKPVSLLAELDTLVPLGKDVGEVNGALVGGGVRFHWRRVGFDVSLLRTLGSTHATFSLISFTYRSAP
jgi:hypothetical protein